ncbi:hypothetical protein BN14_04358 [Rhizoctonia solani AG-1 IB]|uniref:Ion transport domain-containing protein n=1 Tax=Thanatephorus cucumeris (strain AG1-IB / isolate 7/3/14) TaxID=1108050 RepID=M5BSY3_THACB|nr:hypothetical protein BN14_04358 [Rhizoctonia solani AG-1 IB]
MIAEFFVFIMLAAVCFSGLLFTLWTLSRGSATWNLGKIAWLMTQVWFGNTFLSFTVAESFHPIFGPILMVMFAALSNTLLITIMISILSNTFARINEHASEEYLYQFAISTIEGVTNAFSTDDDRDPGMEDSADFGKAQEPEETRQGRPEITLSPTPRRSRSRASRTYREEQQPPSSPLARLFGSVRQRAISAQGDALGDIRKIGEVMENLKEAAVPSDRLRQDIKELSERQARIETLLLTLTRGMRGEGNGSGSVRG